MSADPPLLYLDQNVLSGIAKRKPAFVELEPVLRAAIARGAVAVVESEVHARESAPRPDLGLLELLRGLSGGRRLPPGDDARTRAVRERLVATLARELPGRAPRPSDAADLDALAVAVQHCSLLATDRLMADVLGRSGLLRRFGAEAWSGRRPDVLALRDRLAALPTPPPGR